MYNFMNRNLLYNMYVLKSGGNMNKILNKIKEIIAENIKTYLPDVKPSDLEENGMVYYMNGKNGTEFDWYVNDKISDFMVFYNDEKNLGAAKLTIYNKGDILLYIYGEQGNKIVKEVKTCIEVSEDVMFQLAVILKNEADNKRIWDASIEKINTDNEIVEEKINEFKNNKKYYKEMRRRKELFNLSAYVSKKVFEDGWKVGYMCRDEAVNESDSGWSFMAGNEDDDYVADYKNIVLLSIYEVSQLDPDILNYVDNPVGSRFIRISANEFEVDNHDKEIYTMKS